MFITNDPTLIITVLGILLKAAVIVAIVIIVVKGIKYLKRAEAREIERDRKDAQATIDDIERELNEKRAQP